jgi:hypothetical protein
MIRLSHWRGAIIHSKKEEHYFRLEAPFLKWYDRQETAPGETLQRGNPHQIEEIDVTTAEVILPTPDDPLKFQLIFRGTIPKTHYYFLAPVDDVTTPDERRRREAQVATLAKDIKKVSTSVKDFRTHSHLEDIGDEYQLDAKIETAHGRWEEVYAKFKPAIDKKDKGVGALIVVASEGKGLLDAHSVRSDTRSSPFPG